MDETGPSRGNALRMNEIMSNRDSCVSSDVMEGEDSAASVGIERPHSVLWERVIQQTILIDLDEDESLHFNDLPGTFNVCQSQDSAPGASFHLSENFDDYDTHKGSRDEDPFSGSSLLDNHHCIPMDGTQEGDGTQSSEIRVSAQRPNTKEASLAHKYEEAGNTSDEDQEDLPYDGDLNHDLGSTTDKPDGDIINQSARESGLECISPAQSSILDSVSVKRAHVNNTSPSLVLEQADEIYYPSAREIHTTDSRTGVIEGGEDVPEVFGHTTPTAAKGLCQPMDAAAQSNIKELLVQHFFPDELLDPNLFIEAETLPEVSFADSADETILSKTLPLLKLGTDITVSQGGIIKQRLKGEMKAFGEEGKQQAKESQGSKDMPPAGSDVVLSPLEEFIEYDREVSSIQGNNGVQIHSSLLARAQSYNELKYGQGQVHYPLPDFSKVASKIKIPKASAAKPACHQPGVLRAQSSPGMLGKSLSSCKAAMDVINKVLEDTIQPPEAPYIFSEQPKHQEESPKSTELVQHLQAEYDKLLTKYAEAENLIDQMRLGSKTQSPVDPVALEGRDILEVQVLENTTHQGDLPSKHLHPKGYSEDLGDPRDDSCPTQTNQMHTSEGEKMTTELLEIISQYTQKVDDFQNCLSLMSIEINEQQMVFKSLMDALDQLERNYIAKKDEHRALEMQNYMGLSRNTGEFDPERIVEGEIFKISMQLEDIRELIDKNIRNQISPPASCSTPAPSLPLDASPSPPPPACEELPSSSQNVGTEEDSTELSHVLAFAPQTRDDPALITQCSGHTSTSPDHSDTSLERLGFGRCEEEEDEERADKGVGSVHHGTFLPMQSVTPPTTLETSQRSESVLPWGCDGSSPHYPVTQTQGIFPQAQSVSQRIVIPETDSGFGGSNPNLPAAEKTPFQSETERSRLYSEEHSSTINTSGSDSDASYSAMQMTTVQNVSSWKHNEGPQLSANMDCKTYGSERAISAAAGGQSHTSRQHVYCAGDDHPVPPPETLGFSRDWRRRHSAPTDANTNLCSCHSEAISALQLEVARLKQELKESLFQLPHITKRMDYLTSRYDQVKRPKAKPRAHLRGSSSSGLRHSGYRHRKETMNTDSNLSKAEDWISSDLEPNSETGDPLQSMRLQHSGTFHQVGEGRDSWPRPCTEKRWRQRSARLESTEDMETSHSEVRPFLNVVKPLQKPLLQVNYSSSYSLPAGFKAMEPQSAGQHRRRSTQSDSALLPSNVYFLRPQCHPQASRSSGSSSSYRRGRDEYISRTLDRAIEAAQSMKRRTDRMARSLSADLAKAELHGKLCHPYPGRHPDNPDS